MRNLILFTLSICCIGQITRAQVRVTDISEPDLKGSVKRVIEYIYRGVEGKVDTTHPPGKRIRNFDPSGNELNEVSYKNNGEIQDTCVFIHDKDGMILETEYGNNHNLIGTLAFKYDNKGNEIASEIVSNFDPIVKIGYENIYLYDNVGHRIEEDKYLNGGQLYEKAVGIYNEQNRKTQENRVIYFDNKQKKQKVFFKYDDFGNIIKTEYYNSEGKLTEESSSLPSNIDREGNWQMKVDKLKYIDSKTLDFVMENITKRYIEYY